MEEVTAFIANASYQASALLAEEKGNAPSYKEKEYVPGPFFQEALTEETRALVKEKGLRNIAILSIAPTGSISNIVLGFRDGTKNYIGVSSGIEPIFSLYYTRRSESFGNVFFKVFHATVQAYIDVKGLQKQVQGATHIDELRKTLPAFLFRTAHFIEPIKRVRIQGICQKYIDHSISSTVNLPEDIHPEVISNIYLDAWKHRLKGITIYRDGSRYPILSVEGEKTFFQEFKEKVFKITVGTETKTVKGNDVIARADGTLTTLFHELHGKKPEIEVNKHAEVRLK